MKTFTFSKNSWHYKLQRFMREIDAYSTEENLCDYISGVILSVIKIIIGSTILLFTFSFISSAIMNAIFGIIFSIITHSFMFSDIGVAGLILISFTFLAAAGWWVTNNINKHDFTMSEDNFIKVAYQSIKGKFCAKVTFVE